MIPKTFMIPNVDNPFLIFRDWYEEAKKQLDYEHAVSSALATATKDGVPDVRMVLIKQWDENGFIFYTNFSSKKGQQLDDNPKAALCFYWYKINKQVRIRGNIQKVEDLIADQYFGTRDRISQIGAWASKQSQVLNSRFELEKNVVYYLTKFGVSKVPRPPFWGGYRLIPNEIEFWLKKPYRLHERVLFERDINNKTLWNKKFLYP
ncbi:MAG: pyridoxamine 5'-phosphate oxidase [Candidatus Hydrogenedens sp.]|nr:pyridoxamine 5'-phosphate oxidase [Candidatus Hydrogenedens sp.]